MTEAREIPRLRLSRNLATLVMTTALAHLLFAPGAAAQRVAAETAAGRGPASNEVLVTVSPTGNGPIVLTGTQSMVISGDVVMKNDIVLRDSAVLTIQNATFTHAVDYAQQYALWAYDHTKVVVQDSTIKSSPWINWHFVDDASLQMMNVVNDQSRIWHSFQGRGRATAVNVSRFRGTVADSASFVVDGAAETYIETVFVPGATVDESYPPSVGTPAYTFPNAGETGGTFPRLTLRNVGSTKWGITYVPQDNVTIRNTRSLTVTFSIDSPFTGLTAQFADLKATLYADQTWTAGDATLHLVNTTTLPWSPIVKGNNALIITDSELADISGCGGNANVSISDSSLAYVRTHDTVRLALVRSSVAGDVVAGDNSIVELTDAAVGGKIVKEGNGLVVLHSVLTTGKGFVLNAAGSITTKPDEVISGKGSIKGSSFGSALYNGYLHTDARVITFVPNETYRITFRYRILTAPSRGFEVLFISNTAAAAGSFLPSTTITGSAGDSGVATLTTTLGSYADYQAAWNVTGTGAIVIDDIQIVDVATGEVVASESAETLATTP